MRRFLINVSVFALVLLVVSPVVRAQDSSPYGGCVDSLGHPVKSVQDTSLKDVAQATLGMAGEPIILYNPTVLAGALPETRLFWYLHECGHHALGHVALRTAYGIPAERAADCWAAQILVTQQKMSPERFQQIAAGFAYNPGDWQHLPGPQRTLDIARCAFAARPVLVITPAESADLAGNIRTVTDELRSGSNTIRGDYERMSGKTAKLFKATFAIYPSDPGECRIRDFTYGSPAKTDVTYVCVWTTISLRAAQEIYTRLFDALQSNCNVKNAKTAAGSEIRGKCGDDINVEGDFGQHKDDSYEVSVSLERNDSR